MPESLYPMISMVGVNGFVVLPHGQDPYEAGSRVEAVILSPLERKLSERA